MSLTPMIHSWIVASEVIQEDTWSTRVVMDRCLS